MTNSIMPILPALALIAATNRAAVNLAWNSNPCALTQLQESDDQTNWRWVEETTNTNAAVFFYGTNVGGVHYFRARTVLYSPFSNIASVTNITNNAP